MNYLVKTQNFSLSDEQRAAATQLGISEVFFKLLLSRGMNESDMKSYLHPSLEALSSPFDIAGMDAASKRLSEAVRRKEKILVYGDYDCDGICAVSILMLCLRDRADISYFIPDRNRDGYGISVPTLERIFASKRPDLIITVDCGITAIDEVRYIKSKGIDVIVTDHHEPQEQLPDCIVVDAKIERRGFHELCGAGVALKLAQAVVGMSEAYKYLDIAAIATLADVVPLVGDNRIIAYYGLKALRSSTRKGIKLLLGDDAIDSHAVMFKLAPRLNAAGRLNSAMKVVDLFLESDYFLLKTLAEELIRDNQKRQAMCSETVEEAKAMLKGADFNALGVIILYGEKWETGILGIAAAKLVEEFKRPAILLGKNGDELKGSARSVPKVNIFELLSDLSDCFTSFGGHAQAAGVSLKSERLEEFIRRANEKVLDSHSFEDFMPSPECEMLLDKDTDLLKFAKELELMEPTGYCNPRPTFLMDEEGLNFERIGFSKHVKYQGKGFEIVGFSKFYEQLACRAQRLRLEVTLGANVFQNNVTAQALIRSASTVSVDFSKSDCIKLNLHQLAYSGEADVERISVHKVLNLLEKPFGTCICCFDCEEYEKLKRVMPELPEFALSGDMALNPRNITVLCPGEGFDFSYFTNVVIAGDPLCEGYIKHIADSVENCFMLEDCNVSPISVKDDVLRKVYAELLGAAQRRERFANMRKLYLYVCSRYKVCEEIFCVAMQIFSELELVKILDRGLIEASKKPVRLLDSATYKNVNLCK